MAVTRSRTGSSTALVWASACRPEELWRIAPDQLEEAQNDATILALHDQERAGIDVLTDGEMRRESYSNRFANALSGVDPVQARPDAARRYAVSAIDRALKGASGTTALHVCFGCGRHVSDKPPGYSFLEELDVCAADQISLECAQPKVDPATLAGLPSKTILLGVLDLRDTAVETPEQVAARIRAALEHVPAERLVIAPDGGFKYLPRDVSFGKLRSMVQGRDLARAELA